MECGRAYCAVETAAQAKEHKLDKPRTKDRTRHAARVAG